MKRVAVRVAAPVDGGVEVPFSAVCSVNRRSFAGKVTVSWFEQKRVPEYGALAAIVAKAKRRQTTCEALAVDVRNALARSWPDGLVVRVDVTSEAHFRAWAVAIKPGGGSP